MQSDEWFAAQRLVGVVPMMIKLFTKIPDKLVRHLQIYLILMPYIPCNTLHVISLCLMLVKWEENLLSVFCNEWLGSTVSGRIETGWGVRQEEAVYSGL